MKTTKFLSLAALVLIFAACSNDDYELTAMQPTETGGITITATLAPKTATTRAVADNGDNKITVTWAQNEHIAILYEVKSVKKVADATITAVNDDGSATISFSVDGGTPNNTVCQIVYPKSAAKDDNSGVKDAATLLAAQDGTLSANLDVRVGEGTIQTTPARLDVTTQPAAQFAIFKFNVVLKNNMYSGYISAKSLTITIGTQDYVITPTTPTKVLYAALPAVDAQKVSFDARDISNQNYTCEKLSTTFSAGYYYQSNLNMRVKRHSFVDMGEVNINGVSKHLYWATCNIGADNPWDYGGYYAWGETTTKDTYTWSNYAFMQAGQSDWTGITRYTIADGHKSGYSYDGGIWYNGDIFIGDGKTSFADYNYADDAARQKWGDQWHIPTDAEWTALRNASLYDWVWTADYLNDGSNHAGWIVTRKTGTCSGNSIFLPAAGYRSNASLSDEGSRGYYWSSSLDESNSFKAKTVFINSGGEVAFFYDPRYYGESLRPVYCPLAAADVTPLTIGKMLGADGNIYDDAAQASAAGTTAQAVIAYVGSVPNYFDKFLAIARDDYNYPEMYDWYDAQDCVGEYAANHAITIGGTTYNTNAIGKTYYDQVTDDMSVSSATRTDGVVKGWRLPSVTDWRYVFDGLCRQRAGQPLTVKTQWKGNWTTYTNNATPTDPLGVKCVYYFSYKSGESSESGFLARTLYYTIVEACGVGKSMVASNYWSSSELFTSRKCAWTYDFGTDDFFTLEKDKYDYGWWSTVAFGQVRTVFAY